MGAMVSPIDPLNLAIETICISMMRLVRTSASPGALRRALQADIVDKNSYVPTPHECSMLVEACNERLEPQWFVVRWPRTLGLLTAVIWQ